MSISPTTSYVSNDSIIAWMETKTSGEYASLSDSMDLANTRADQEQTLNDIKELIVSSKTNGGDAKDLRAAVSDALQKYEDDPEMTKALQPISDSIEKAYSDAEGSSSTTSTSTSGDTSNNAITTTVTINDDQRKAWGDDIDAALDPMGKQDQLGMIDIQQMTSEINQAKQIASAILDSADSAAKAIINHIS